MWLTWPQIVTLIKRMTALQLQNSWCQLSSAWVRDRICACVCSSSGTMVGPFYQRRWYNIIGHVSTLWCCPRGPQIDAHSTQWTKVHWSEGFRFLAGKVCSPGITPPGPEKWSFRSHSQRKILSLCARLFVCSNMMLRSVAPPGSNEPREELWGAPRLHPGSYQKDRSIWGSPRNLRRMQCSPLEAQVRGLHSSCCHPRIRTATNT